MLYIIKLITNQLFLLILNKSIFGGVLKSMLTLNEAIIDVKEG